MLKHLKLDVSNSKLPFTARSLRAIQNKFSKLPKPAFEVNKLNFKSLKKQLQPYQKYKNIIIIANGGSRTSAVAYYQSLSHLRNKKNLEFLSTLDPEYIRALKKKYNQTNTLVMPISKSGTNIDVLEPLLHFLSYKILPITLLYKGLLYEMAKIYNWDIIEHPEVGGRFAGRTNCGFAPAMLMGLDVEKINKSAVASYKSVDFNAPARGNAALVAAIVTAGLEKKGYTQIFMPIYSHSLTGFLPLIVQLFHESTGKNKKGQTIFGDEAPESQHHTNQRFFGGPRNVLGWFITVRNHPQDAITKVPSSLKKLPLLQGELSNIANIPLSQALRFDYEGVAENASKLKIPHFTLEIDEVNESSVGELMSFFHFYAIYSALLRGQNPFNQPQVEAAKALSFTKRLKF